ncbi:MAG: sigma-70 family RNA polymerase sigma factor [Anaerolineae bacterium]|nr:sigma-70 family RNA polymerase sigma factor [Anaerolineae bacterium]
MSLDYSKLCDESLLYLIRRRHEAALGALYDRYNGLVFSIALEIVGDRHIANDILQDVFASVWQKADSYRVDRGQVKVWLASLARHRAIDVKRKQTRDPEGHSVDLAAMDFGLTADTPDPEDTVDVALQGQRLHEALSALPPEQRQALEMAYFGGLTTKQIAERLGEPQGTIKTRIRLALLKLRQALLVNPEAQKEIP